MPREKMPRELMQFGWQAQYLVKVDSDFSWQAQYLVKLQGDGSWQTQHFVTFWKVAGARNVVFSYKMRLQDGTSQVSEAAGARLRFYP